jgi:glucan phosphorylase
MRFDSYAEASKEKEKISKIRNTTNSQTPKTMTKEEQEQAIKELKSITPQEWEEAKRLQAEYEIWENEQKRNNNYN